MAAYKCKSIEVPMTEKDWEDLWLNLLNEFEEKLNTKSEIRLKDYFKREVKKNISECFANVKPVIRSMKILKHFKQYEARQVVERVYKRKKNYFYIGFTDEITNDLFHVEPTSEDENSKWEAYKSRNTGLKLNIYYARLTKNSTFNELVERFIDNPLCLNDQLIEKTGNGIGYIIEYEAKYQPPVDDRPKRPKSMKVTDADIEEKEEEERAEEEGGKAMKQNTKSNDESITTQVKNNHEDLPQKNDNKNEDGNVKHDGVDIDVETDNTDDRVVKVHMETCEIEDEYVLQWLRRQSAQRKNAGLLLWVANEN